MIYGSDLNRDFTFTRMNDPKLINAFSLQKKEELINNLFNFTIIQAK